MLVDVKLPTMQPAGSPRYGCGVSLSTCGMNCRAPMARCAAVNADGPVTSTESAQHVPGPLISFRTSGT